MSFAGQSRKLENYCPELPVPYAEREHRKGRKKEVCKGGVGPDGNLGCLPPSELDTKLTSYCLPGVKPIGELKCLRGPANDWWPDGENKGVWKWMQTVPRRQAYYLVDSKAGLWKNSKGEDFTEVHNDRCGCRTSYQEV